MTAERLAEIRAMLAEPALERPAADWIDAVAELVSEVDWQAALLEAASGLPKALRAERERDEARHLVTRVTDTLNRELERRDEKIARLSAELEA